MSLILAGDVGGTKTRLALVTVEGGRVQVRTGRDYASRDYAQFDILLADFLSGTQDGVHAALGIAGPVQGRVARTTNLPWHIDADALQQRFGLRSCSLLNDLEATACGLEALGASDLMTLQAGDPTALGNMAVIAAGTGLGEAGLYWDGRRHRPFASEGGHASFAPGDELEFALLRFLQKRHGHVSWERVVSGMGIVALHAFLCEYRGAPVSPALAQRMRAGDAAAAISQAAAQGEDDMCVETMRRFVRLYGAEAGNLALKTMSRGGLYLGGGIAPKILPLLQTGEFLEAFCGKGRMRPLLEAMPLRVILNDSAALYGPALCAGRTAGRGKTVESGDGQDEDTVCDF